MRSLLFFLGRVYSILFSKLNILILRVWNTLYTGYCTNGFGSFGKGTVISYPRETMIGKSFMTIGSNSSIGKHSIMTAWHYLGSPVIKIGDNVILGDYIHITAVKSIEIGDGVLTGKFVTITDNSHGLLNNIEELQQAPGSREVYSKGPVIIRKNVWIGDKVTILPGVIIGEGAIIGANAVVTKEVPPYTIVGGNPAKIIRIIN